MASSNSISTAQAMTQAIEGNNPSFLGIPQELRDMVYTFVLTRPGHLEHRCPHVFVPLDLDENEGSGDPDEMTEEELDHIEDCEHNSSCTCITDSQANNTEPGQYVFWSLLLVNRQIRGEAASAVGQRNVVCFNDPEQIDCFVASQREAETLRRGFGWSLETLPIASLRSIEILLDIGSAADDDLLPVAVETLNRLTGLQRLRFVVTTPGLRLVEDELTQDLSALARARRPNLLSLRVRNTVWLLTSEGPERMRHYFDDETAMSVVNDTAEAVLASMP